MIAVGDIVQIFAPIAGYDKYHLCIKIGVSGTASQFLFLNSDPNFRDTYVVDCERVPCIPASETGKTCFSFTMIPRYSDTQLKFYKAKVLGKLDRVLVAELLEFTKTVKGLNAAEKETVLAALTTLI